jgi:electron transfer flavoprotein beta subunit
MRVIVPIKQILDPSGITVRRDKERIFINREEYIIDPGSKAAIEAALQLKDSGDAEVMAISMGKPVADDALREALAMGCDAAYLLSDKAFQDADVSVTARILVAAIEKLGGADLIVAGRASGDTGAGQIGPRLAEALGYAQVTDVYALAAADGSVPLTTGSALRATRRWGEGYATVEASLPAVVTVAPEAFPPRYAHGARIMNAYQQWDVVVWESADLDLDETVLAPLLAFRGESFPPPLEVGETFRGDPASVVQEVVMALKLQRLVD